MNKLFTLVLFATLSLIAPLFAQVPSKLPFGKVAIIEGLTQIDSLGYQIFTRGESGSIDIIGIGGIGLEPFSTTEYLAEQIEQGVEFEFDVDPRKNIFIDVTLFSPEGESLFTSRTSFYLMVERDVDGNPSYSIPEYAKYLHFSFEGVRIKVDGVQAASALAEGKSWGLDVNSNGVWIPGHLARTNTYNTLELVFDSGQVHYYDWFGVVVEEELFGLVPNYVSFNDVTSLPIINGKVSHTSLSSRNGWSQIIEVNNNIDQEIEFEFRSYEGYQVPTHLWLYTIEDNKVGDPVVYQYSENGWVYGGVYSKKHDIPAGNYYIVLEWNDDAKIKGPYSYGGKG